jgi:hypothetical protein
MPIAQTVAADVSSVLTTNLDLARLLKLTEAQFGIYFLGFELVSKSHSLLSLQKHQRGQKLSWDLISFLGGNWCRSHTHY